MGSERKERPQQVWYQAGDENRKLELKDTKENTDCLSDSLATVTSGFPGKDCLNWQHVSWRDGMRKEGFRRESAWLLGVGVQRKKDCTRWSAIKCVCGGGIGIGEWEGKWKLPTCFPGCQPVFRERLRQIYYVFFLFPFFFFLCLSFMPSWRLFEYLHALAYPFVPMNLSSLLSSVFSIFPQWECCSIH